MTTAPLPSAVNLAVGLGRALGGMQSRFAAFSTALFGLNLPTAVLQVSGVVGALQTSAGAAGDLAAAADALENAIDAGELDLLAAFIHLGVSLQSYYSALDGLQTALRAAITPSSVPDAVTRASAEALADDLARRISDYAIASALTNQLPRLAFLITTAGLMEWRFVPPDPADPLSRNYVLKLLHSDRASDLISDPAGHFRNVFRWGQPSSSPPIFDPTSLFKLASEFFPPRASVSTGVAAGDPFLRVGSFELRRDSSVDPPELRLAFLAALHTDKSWRKELSPEWGVGLTSTVRVSGQVSGTLKPPLLFELAPLTGDFLGELRAFIDRNPEARPFDILRGNGLLALTAVNVSAGAEVRSQWNGNAASFEPLFFIELEQGKVAIDTSKADGFLSSVLPSKGIEGEFGIRAEWQPSTGLRLSASGGLEVTLPIHTHIGPLKVDLLYISLRILNDGTLSAETSAQATLSIGPVTVTVDRVGAVLDIRFVDGVSARFGPFDLDLRFKPPSGLGITISAGPITGGGYIYFDEAAGRYAGVLQLEMRSIAIKAIGILDTKIPGGGYSFLIIISAEFSPIQLGLGFTLNGVGGLAGINRTIAIAPLQSGIRNHAADDVLFPKDPVANAPRIISDLQRFFPPLKEHYIFGPAALIGWGTPTLLTIKLGIILEFPPPLRIVLLGQLDCQLPDASAVVQLHVDVLGVLDFGAKTFSLDGIIHDSRVGPYPLYGDFAVRLKWGSNSTFALAIGGFNPHFNQIPAGFPSLRRITIALSDGNNPRLTLQCYLALTSNSLQLGARADLYAQSGGFSVTGWIGFDALVYFHPFGLRVDLSAGFSLRRGSRSLGGIQVDATLTGPSPWHVWGDASITILFVHVKVNFDLTIGNGGPGALASTDIWPALQAAIQTGGNWSAVLPPAAAQVVTLRQPVDPTPSPNAPGLLIDPVGTITLVERTAPLDRTITRFADAPPGGTFHRFDLDQVTINTKPIAGWALTEELFAPALFEQLSDDQKLSRPSFEQMAAGMSLPLLVDLGGFAAAEVTFRTVVFDSPAESHDGVAYPMDAALQVALADVGSAATGGMRVSTQPYVAPGTKPAVTLDEETYVIVWAADLTRRLTAQGPKGAVIAALNDYLATHPADRPNLIVVPEYEAAA